MPQNINVLTESEDEGKNIVPPHPITTDHIIGLIIRGIPVPIAVSKEGISPEHLTRLMANAHRHPLIAAFFKALAEAEAKYLAGLAAQLNKRSCKDWRKIMAILQVRDKNNWGDAQVRATIAAEDKTYL